MWVIIVGSVTFFLTIIFSLAKASSRGEEIAEKHREELLNRGKKETSDDQKTSVANNLDEKKVNSDITELSSSKEIEDGSF